MLDRRKTRAEAPHSILAGEGAAFNQRVFRGGATAMLLAAVLAATAPASLAAPLTTSDWVLAVDVPSTLGGTDYLPGQIVSRKSGPAYSLQAALPPGMPISALHLRPDGRYLFSPSDPVTLGGIDYEPSDVIAWDGATFSLVLDGSAVGLPGEGRIDAYMDYTDDACFSLDVPSTLGSVEYSRSDIVCRDAVTGFYLFWDAEGAGVPASSNVVGAALDRAGSLVVSFDVPTKIGGTEFLPGGLARWTGMVFEPNNEPFWPAYAQMRDFAFFPAAGAVPDGWSVPGSPLTITMLPGGDVTLAWSASCSATDADYEIYEGTLGSYASHAPRFCSTGGMTSKTFTPAPGSTYYLVVPRNALREGSHGRRSDGSERPRGASTCAPQEVALVCP